MRLWVIILMTVPVYSYAMDRTYAKNEKKVSFTGISRSEQRIKDLEDQVKILEQYNRIQEEMMQSIIRCVARNNTAIERIVDLYAPQSKVDKEFQQINDNLKQVASAVRFLTQREIEKNKAKDISSHT